MLPLVLCLVVLFPSSDALKILMFNPKFGFSHMNFMGNIADTLQLGGHNVTIIQSVIVPTIRGTGSVHSKVITVDAVPSVAEYYHNVLGSPDFWGPIWSLSPYNPMGIIGPLAHFQSLMGVTCDNLLVQHDLLASLREEKFDLGITELFDFCGNVLFHSINLTNVVGAHSTGIFEGTQLSIGVPLIPSYVPASQGVTGDDDSLTTRLANLFFTYFSYNFQSTLLNIAQNSMNKHIPNAPNLWDLVAKIPFVLTNSEPLIDFPRPTLHKVVDLGGIGLRHGKPLDEHWSSIMSLRPKTVLVSFGSIAPSSTMPIGMSRNIIAVMKKFPDVTFIWKYETPEDGIAQGAENIILSKWMPQNDILGDPRLSLFVTHGGAGSVMEGVSNGVPLMVVPLFGDQSRNAQMVARLQYGIHYHKSNLFDEEMLESTLKRALTDDSLRSNAKNMARLLSKRPFSPQETLLRTIELAGEFGSMPNLSPAGRNLSYIQYYNLDIAAMFSVIIIITVYLSIRVLRHTVFTKKVKTQ